ncbi:MAG: hypothetical protein WCI50_08095 [Actinomycetes bacterium]
MSHAPQGELRRVASDPTRAQCLKVTSPQTRGGSQQVVGSWHDHALMQDLLFGTRLQDVGARDHDLDGKDVLAVLDEEGVVVTLDRIRGVAACVRTFVGDMLFGADRSDRTRVGLKARGT